MTALTSVLSRACLHLLFTFYNIKLVFIVILSRRGFTQINVSIGIGLYNREFYVFEPQLYRKAILNKFLKLNREKKVCVIKLPHTSY